MLSEKAFGKDKTSSEEDLQEEKHPVEILKTDKNDTSSNPLHEDLSEESDEEDEVASDNDTKD